MTLEKRVKALEDRLDNLQESFIQAQTNNIAVTAKADEVEPLKNNVADITPYTETKQAYIDDTAVVFENVPQGNLTVFCEVSYTVDRQGDRVVISFEPLDRVIEITINVL